MSAGCRMRYLYVVTLVLFVGGIAIFSAQNLQTVEVSFLWLNANLRLAFVIVGIYLLGAVTGGSLWALLRQSFKGAGLSS
jgi:putative membrane protein